MSLIGKSTTRNSFFVFILLETVKKYISGYISNLLSNSSQLILAGASIVRVDVADIFKCVGGLLTVIFPAKTASISEFSVKN